MSISAIDKRYLKITAVNAIAALLCAIAGIIYLKLSYGQYSPFMSFAFIPPLVNAAISLLISFTSAGNKISRAAFNLWNSGIATLTAGFFFRGVVNISGRVTDFDVVYYMLAAAFGIAAVIVGTVSRVRHKGDDI